MPKSQLEVMSTDWERSQEPVSEPESLCGPGSDCPPPPGATKDRHLSRSTSWSIRTISHIPVSSLVTWDCLMCARMMAGLSRKAILSLTLSQNRGYDLAWKIRISSATASSSLSSVRDYFLLSKLYHVCQPVRKKGMKSIFMPADQAVFYQTNSHSISHASATEDLKLQCCQENIFTASWTLSLSCEPYYGVLRS